MTTYADPTRCPECRAVLPHDPQTCPVCSLPLTGPTAGSLFASLQEADRLLGLLRSQRRPAPVMVGAPTATSPLAGVPPYPSAAKATRSPRLRGASVPKILLALGALCLLVAALIFLAVAWHWLGVGGRTLVLVALTGTTLGLTAALDRRALRTAAEALATVGLGLVALDVFGMRHAGWLGQVTDARTTMFAGAVVTTVALALLLLTSSRPLVVPGLVAPVATFVAGAASVWGLDSRLRVVVTCAALLALGRVGTALRLRSMAAVSMLLGGIAWLALVVDGYVALVDDSLTVHHLWGDLAGWPLFAAAALMALAGPAVGLGRTSTHVGHGIAGLLASYVVVLPALDNGSTDAATALLVLTAFWTVALALAPVRLPAPVIPLVGTAVFPMVCVVGLLTSSLDAVLTVGDPFTQPFGVHVAHVYVDPSRWLLLPLVVVVSAACCALASCLTPLPRRRWVAATSCAGFAGVVTSLPLYDVPLAVVVGGLVVVAVAALVLAERRPSQTTAEALRLVAVTVTAAAVMIALTSDRLTSAVLVVACAISAFLMARADSTGAVAAVCFPVAFAGLVWAGGNVMGMDEQFRAIPVLIVLGGLTIWKPRPELEASSAFVAVTVSTAAILVASDTYVSTAVHLTVAGVLVTASSIVHPSRRHLSWPGGALLAAATWVRLVDLGVHVPEAYTLPSALVLVAVSGWRLRRDARSATLTVLTPGLALATVPSLVAMLHDPYSLRALLLGAACLGLTLVGASLRWSAPLVVGPVVGALLVLREVAPYAAQVPTWLTIGVAGAVLLVVGVTWESRMSDVRRASRYVGALR